MPTAMTSFSDLAVNGGDVLLVGDDGSIQFVDSSGARSAPVSTGLDAPMAVPFGAGFAVAGRWRASVQIWSPNRDRPERDVQLFGGRITALAAHGGELFVAGAERAASTGAAKDKVPLAAGEIYRLTERGEPEKLAVSTTGLVEHLAATAGGLVFTDRAQRDQLTVFRAGESPATRSISVAKGPVTALAVRGDRVVFSTASGLHTVDPTTGKVAGRERFPKDFLTVLDLVAIGKKTFTATSEGVYAWPGSSRVGVRTEQPVAIAAKGSSLVVLWSDGALEESR